MAILATVTCSVVVMPALQRFFGQWGLPALTGPFVFTAWVWLLQSLDSTNIPAGIGWSRPRGLINLHFLKMSYWNIAFNINYIDQNICVLFTIMILLQFIIGNHFIKMSEFNEFLQYRLKVILKNPDSQKIKILLRNDVTEHNIEPVILRLW